jgi:hypothetical protein
MGVFRLLLSGLVVIVFGAGCGSGSGAKRGFPGERVLASTRLSEEGAAEKGRWLVWMESGAPNPAPPRSATRVLVRDARSGEVVRVNPPGTFAETGDISGGRLYFQLIRRNRSSIATFDLTTRRVVVLPGFVNRGRWAWRPSVSGNWLLFGEIDYAAGRYAVVAADLRARTRRVVAAVAGHAAYAAPGQVSGEWATWTACPGNKCNVHRLNLRTGVEANAPAAAVVGLPRYGPSVAPDGTVYFGQCTTVCGASKIVRWSRGSRLETVATLRDGTAFQYSYVNTARGRTRLLYDAVACDKHALSDIYALSPLDAKIESARKMPAVGRR